MVIIPADDIPASSEVTGTVRLGLPKIPRANTQALAAINAITRILDELVLLNTGGVTTGLFTMEELEVDLGTITNLVATLATFQAADITHITATSATLVSGTVDELTAVQATITEADIPTAVIQSLTAVSAQLTTAIVETLTSTDATLTNATVESLEATAAVINTLTIQVATFNSVVTNSLESESITTEYIAAKVGTFESLHVAGNNAQVYNSRLGVLHPKYISATPVSHGAALNIVPNVIEYTVFIKDYINDPKGAATLTSVGALVRGSWSLRTGEYIFTVLDTGTLFQASDNRTGSGFPKVDGIEVFTISLQHDNRELHLTGTEATYDANLVELTAASVMAYDNASTFECTFEAHQYPVA